MKTTTATLVAGALGKGGVAVLLAALVSGCGDAKPSTKCTARNVDQKITVGSTVWDCETKTKKKVRKIGKRKVTTYTVSYRWERD